MVDVQDEFATRKGAKCDQRAVVARMSGPGDDRRTCASRSAEEGSGAAPLAMAAARVLRDMGPMGPFIPAKTVEHKHRPTRFEDVSAIGAAAAALKRRRSRTLKAPSPTSP